MYGEIEELPVSLRVWILRYPFLFRLRSKRSVSRNCVCVRSSPHLWRTEFASDFAAKAVFVSAVKGI